MKKKLAVSPAQLTAWKAAGSLHYLAHYLGKTLKQVGRYWDQGWIPGCYRTERRGRGGAGGRHRRVRYTGQTVAIVVQRVGLAKETNLRRRYPTRSRHSGSVLWESKLAREAILGYQRLDLEDVAEERRLLDLLPLEEFLATGSPGEFRAAALAAYREIRGLESEGESESGSDRRDAALLDRVLLPLLSQPTLAEFVTAYEEAVEQLTWRDVEGDSQAAQAAVTVAVSKPVAAMFTAAVVAMGKAGRRASVAAVARELSISRSGLYRLCARLHCREDLETALALAKAGAGNVPGS